MLKYLVFAVSLCAFATASFYQILIPKETFGYPYINGSNNAPVKMNVWQDLQCPDANASYPVLKEVGDHYGPDQVRIIFNGFPLPYKRGAFLSARATRAVDQLDSTLTIPYIDLVFANQHKIGKSPDTVSDSELLNILADLAEDVGLNRQVFLDEYNEPQTDYLTRVEWKVGITAGVYSSPTIFLNHVVHLDFDTSWTLENWTAIIDQLMV